MLCNLCAQPHDPRREKSESQRQPMHAKNTESRKELAYPQVEVRCATPCHQPFRGFGILVVGFTLDRFPRIIHTVSFSTDSSREKAASTLRSTPSLDLTPKFPFPLRPLRAPPSDLTFLIRFRGHRRHLHKRTLTMTRFLIPANSRPLRMSSSPACANINSTHLLHQAVAPSSV